MLKALWLDELLKIFIHHIMVAKKINVKREKKRKRK